MFSEKLSSIIERMPANARALDLIAQYLDEADAQRRLHKLRLDPTLISRISGLDAGSELADVIGALISGKVLKRVVLVESPSGGSVAQFDSYDDVPDVLHDHLTDSEMRVSADNLRTVYVAAQ